MQKVEGIGSKVMLFPFADLCENTSSEYSNKVIPYSLVTQFSDVQNQQLLPHNCTKNKSISSEVVSRTDIIYPIARDDVALRAVRDNFYSTTKPSWFPPITVFADTSHTDEFFSWLTDIRECVQSKLPGVSLKSQFAQIERKMDNNYATTKITSECPSLDSIQGSLIFHTFVYRRVIQRKKKTTKKKSKVSVSPSSLIVSLSTPSSTQRIAHTALRPFIYEAYNGKCQFCAHSSELPYEMADVDHIIPRKVKLSVIENILRMRDGISNEHVRGFCTSFLPPIHDCVLNYSLACRKHNSKKWMTVPHCASLEQLLSSAQDKSSFILKKYKEHLVEKEKAKRPTFDVDVVFE
jgi:hypothetical protein